MRVVSTGQLSPASRIMVVQRRAAVAIAARAVKNVLPDLPDAEDRLDRTYPGDQPLTRQHRFAGAQRRFGVDTDEVEQLAHLLRAANHCMLSGQIADAGGALCSMAAVLRSW